jgi:hypothetical protein
MMGTYDTRGGTPASPSGEELAPSKLAEDVLSVLEEAKVATTVNDKIVNLIEAAQTNNDYRIGFADGVAKSNLIYKDWAMRLRRAAQKTREEGTWDSGWPFHKKFVAKKWEENARQVDEIADLIDKVRTEVAEKITPEYKLPDRLK